MSVNLSKQDNRTRLVSEVKAIDAEMERLKAERATRIGLLLAEVDNQTGKHSSAAGAFTVSENNVYSEAAMREALSPGQVKRVSKAVLDKSVVKRLYPKVYEGAKENRGYKVTVS